MSVKSRSDLVDEIIVQINANGIESITGPILQSILKDVSDSSVNLLGDTAIQGKLGYSTLITLSADGDIVYKKFVTDLIAATVSDTAYNESTWNGVTTVAPSKNAVRDEFENRVAKLTGNVLFQFPDANSLGITNDNGIYGKSYIVMDNG